MVNSGTDTTKIRALAASRPFTQQEGGFGVTSTSTKRSLPADCGHFQVDVVFPSDLTLENALSEMDFTYQTCEMSLTNFVQFAKPYVSQVSMERYFRRSYWLTHSISR